MNDSGFFGGLVGKDEAKLALTLFAINPRCGGCILLGKAGTGKSLLAQSLREILPSEEPFIKLPLHVSVEDMQGGFDFAISLKAGKALFKKGLLDRVHGGRLLVDDINLLSPSILHMLMRALDEGRFSLIATADPLAGSIPPAIGERIGLYAFLAGLSDEEERVRIMELSMKGWAAEKVVGRESLVDIRQRLKKIKISVSILEEIAKRILASGITSHRRDVYLLEAAKAYAALLGAEEVLTTHVERVLPFVLPFHSSLPKKTASVPPRPTEEGADDADAGLKREGKGREQVFPVGPSYEIRPLTFPMDRLSRASVGRRTPTKVKKRGGRGIGVTSVKGQDIALGATIRAAAPYQTMRGRTSAMIIKEEDLRFWRRTRKTGHLVIFITDASGSMGVNRRMIETKGAILSLLLDCYRNREQVAMVAFRQEQASVLLPPTSSVTAAVRRLEEMPVGGKTPLAHGLMTAAKMVIKTARKSPETRFLLVLITDGRANYSVSGAPVMVEILRLAEKMRALPRTDFVVVDTEDKASFLKTDRARVIADFLGAKYFAMADLRAKKLSGIIRNIAHEPH